MTESPVTTPTLPLRNWLDGLKDWQFTLVLYLLRWAIVLPLMWLVSPFAAPEDRFQMSSPDPWRYLLPFLVFAPTLETLLECTIPYALMYKIRGRQPQSPWPFVLVAALAMVVLHPLTPIVVMFAFITGAFLAYVYVHFGPTSQLKAFLHTTIFHSGINLVGWTLMFLQS